MKKSGLRFPDLYYGWIVVAASFVSTSLGIGARYTFPVFYPVILADFHWERGITATIMSLNMLVFALACPLAGVLVTRLGPRRLFSMGGILVGVGLAACSLATTIWQFDVFFGFVVALGVAALGGAPYSVIISNWFVEKRGKALGIAFAGGGGASFIVASLAQPLIDSFGWRMSFVIMGGIMMAIVVAINATLQGLRPEDRGLFPDGRTAIKVTEGLNTTSRQAGGIIPGGNWTRVLTRYQFWSLFFCFLTMGIGFMGVAGHQIAYAMDLGFDPLVAASVFGAYGIGNVIGHLFGFTSDRWGRERTYAVAMALSALAIIILMQAVAYRQVWILYLYTIMFGLGMGLGAPVAYCAVADIFSDRHLGLITGIMVGGYGIGSAIGPAIAGYVFDKAGSYSMAFLWASIIMCLSGVAMWPAAPRKGRLEKM